jgi:hypothetical protein
MQLRKFKIFQFLLFLIVLSACSTSIQVPEASPTPAQTSTTPFIQPSPTASSTATATETTIPTRTQTPTLIPTLPPHPPIPTATSTPDPTDIAATQAAAGPTAVVEQQAHCRYGPGTAYLHSHDLYPGDRGAIDGRNASGSWLWFQPAELDRHCWVAASVVSVEGDVAGLPVVTSKLPYTTLYGPPENVQAARDGNEVTIAWDPINMTVDDFRGYFLSLTVCQDGRVVYKTLQTNDTLISITDDTNCSNASSGTVQGVDKHGYTQPVDVPWP